MIPSPSLTNTRNQAIKEFNSIRTRAILNSWLARILMKHNGLRSLVGSNVTGMHAKRMPRIQRIRVDQIVGTIRYTEEFDQNFRPLKPQSCDRWVQALLQLAEDRWQPIVVHKVGESYYVAQGHHQVSVARYAGMKFIPAEVWDHSAYRKSEDACASMHEVCCRQRESFSTN